MYCELIKIIGSPSDDDKQKASTPIFPIYNGDSFPDCVECAVWETNHLEGCEELQLTILGNKNSIETIKPSRIRNMEDLKHAVEYIYEQLESYQAVRVANIYTVYSDSIIFHTKVIDPNKEIDEQEYLHDVVEKAYELFQRNDNDFLLKGDISVNDSLIEIREFVDSTLLTKAYEFGLRNMINGSSVATENINFKDLDLMHEILNR